MTGPSDFPVLLTPKVAIRTRKQGFHVCRVCGLAVEPRNSRRHHAACQRRKREAPALWWEWFYDMHDIPEHRRRMLRRA